MARPQKEGLEYFPHDVYASSDEKIEPLILLYGSKGYSFYFLHLEYIYRNKDLEFDISDAETREVIQQKLHISADEYDQILQTALKKKCFDKKLFDETNKLTSNGIKKRAVSVLEKREKMRVAYEKKNICNVSAAETTHIKESKVKESKDKVNINILSSKIFADNSQEIKLTNELINLIRENNKDFKQPNIQKWAKDFDLMIRLDDRAPDDIGQVMTWAQRDTFWKGNILSPGKLRDKYDQLKIQMQSKGEQPNAVIRPDSRSDKYAHLYTPK